MKRTEQERKQRDLRKAEKKREALERRTQSGSSTQDVGKYINDLFSLFRFDEEEIFNANSDEKILELLEKMKDELPQKQWDNVLRKGIKKTEVNQRDRAFNDLKELMGI